MVVPGLHSTVSMHGHVIGPILMLMKCTEHAVQEMDLGQLIPRARRRQGSPVPDPPVHQKSCEKYGLSRHPFTLVLCRFPEVSTNW